VWPVEKQVQSRERLHRAFTAANPRLGYWQSEYCILEPANAEVKGGGGRDLGMGLALYVARIIHDDLTVAQARSWQWWTAVSQVDYKDGLVYLDDGSAGDSGRMGAEAPGLVEGGAGRQRKLPGALGNYARLLRPGMVRVRCQVEPEQSIVDGVLAPGYKDTGGGLVVVLVNLSRDDVACDLGAPGRVDVYTTSSRSDLERSRQDAAGIRLPARAVVTCVLR